MSVLQIVHRLLSVCHSVHMFVLEIVHRLLSVCLPFCTHVCLRDCTSAAVCLPFCTHVCLTDCTSAAVWFHSLWMAARTSFTPAPTAALLWAVTDVSMRRMVQCLVSVTDQCSTVPSSSVLTLRLEVQYGKRVDSATCSRLRMQSSAQSWTLCGLPICSWLQDSSSFSSLPRRFP